MVRLTEANPIAPRVWVPPKMTSSILPAPRSCFELVSPITQRIASEILLSPEPFGPTTPVMPGPIVILVRSGKDLNPWISSSFSRMQEPFVAFYISSFLGNGASFSKCEPLSNSGFFSHLFQRRPGGLLFGGLFAAPGTGGKRLSVQPHFHCKLFVVRGAFFLDDGIAELGAGGFLCNLLQLG